MTSLLRLRKLRWIKLAFVIWICVCAPTTVLASSSKTSQSIRIPAAIAGTDEIYSYVAELLSRVIANTDEDFGHAFIVPTKDTKRQLGQLRSLEHNILDVTWSVTTLSRERHHRAVKIPIMAGLFGYRVLLVRKEDELNPNFLSLADLRKRKAVQGVDWPDTEILTFNKIPVITATYEAGFQLLTNKFADYYPRGIHEAQNELEVRPNGNLAVHANSAFVYPSAMFFFVRSSDEQLALRLEAGLERMFQSGELSALIRQQRFYLNAQYALSNRKLIPLNNPLISDSAKEALATYATNQTISSFSR